MAELLSALGLRQAGGNYAYIKSLLQSFELSVAHWPGRGWSRGLTKQSDVRVARKASLITWSDDEIFVANSPRISGDKLMKRLVARGRLYKCVGCDNPGEWEGRPLSLEVHHINGIRNDNRDENLQILCPNCHRQTPNWGSTKQ